MNSGQELNKFENPKFSNFRSEDKGSTCTISSTLFDCIVTGTAHCCVGETSLRRSLYMSLTFMNHTTTYYRKRISSNSHSYGCSSDLLLLYQFGNRSSLFALLFSNTSFVQFRLLVVALLSCSS